MPRGYRVDSITFNVAPRYSPGSPAAVNAETALKVARDERECYEVALDGIYGEAEQEKAKKLGLDLIVFEMVSTKDAWLVADTITKKQYKWPYEAKCPNCRKKFNCRRGNIDAHQDGNPEFNPCARITYIGTELRYENMFQPLLELKDGKTSPSPR